eukprot:6190427-Pleurochrysis_carterae.AAC.2
MTWPCKAFRLHTLRRDDFGSERGLYERREILGSGSLTLVERRGHPVGRVGVDQVSDVFVLLKKNMVSVARDVHVKQVAYWAFIFDVPTRRQVRCERLVEGTDPVIGIKREEIIDVAPDD